MRRVVVFFLFSFAFLYNFVSGDLIAYYDFEQQEGTVVVDRSGLNHHGTLEAGYPGSSTELPSYVTSHDGSQAMRFGYHNNVPGAGWNDFWIPKTDNLVYLGQNWSMAFWARQDDNGPEWSGNYPRVISSPNYEIELGAEGDPYSYFWPYDANPPWGQPGSWDMTMAVNPYQQWFHMLVIYDGTTLTQYINGDPVFTKSDMGPFVESTWPNNYPDTPLRIGAQSNLDRRYLVGLLDDVAIWNETVDANDVNDIMDGTYFLPYKNVITIGEPEDDTPITYLWDPSFIIRYNNGQVVLGFGEKAAGVMSWNWQMEGILDDPNYYGLVNAGLWDGDGGTIEYAGFCTVGDNITQVALGRRAFQDITYDFKARVGGENAVGNIVGVKFYRVDPDPPYGNEVLIKTLSTTIATNQTWVELNDTYTATADDDNKRFKVVCYTAGPGRGSRFAYFDYVRIDPIQFLTCQAQVDYNFGSSGLARDLNNDCRVDMEDYSIVAQDWYFISPPEPSMNTGELLTNSDFYADLDLVPNNGDFVAAVPTGWEFTPATSDEYVAGIQNRDNNGNVANAAQQPAGGSVVAYIDPNTVLQQTVASDQIQNGQNYYISAMVAGSGGAYLSMVTMTLEYVDNPVSPSTVVPVASDTFVLPEALVWRQMTTQFTADAAAAGKYLRIKFDLGPNPFPGSTASGYANIGKASITTVKPDTWPRQNLLVNGDFEDYSSLPLGTNNNDGYLDLFSYVTHYTMNSIPGWDASSNSMWYYGLQCMLWAPPPQPAMGRVSAWFQDTIEQYVDSELMQEGQTYYLDYIASINNSAYQVNDPIWPVTDPNMAVDVYWLAANQSDLSGTEGVDWGLVTSLQMPITGALVGSAGNPYGRWVSPETSFTVDASLAGKGLYVSAYCGNATVDYPTFEEIYLSKEPRVQIGPYTCYEQTNTYGLAAQTDLNGDCSVDLDDVALFVDNWLGCNDPLGCN